MYDMFDHCGHRAISLEDVLLQTVLAADHEEDAALVLTYWIWEQSAAAPLIF